MFCTLFILSSAEPLNMNSVFIIKSVTVVFSRTSMSLCGHCCELVTLCLAVVSLFGRLLGTYVNYILATKLIMTVPFPDAYWDSVTCSLLLLLCKHLNLQLLHNYSVLSFTLFLCSVVFRHKHVWQCIWHLYNTKRIEKKSHKFQKLSPESTGQDTSSAFRQ